MYLKENNVKTTTVDITNKGNMLLIRPTNLFQSSIEITTSILNEQFLITFQSQRRHILVVLVLDGKPFFK